MANVADTKLYDILGVPPGASDNELKKVRGRGGARRPGRPGGSAVGEGWARRRAGPRGAAEAGGGRPRGRGEARGAELRESPRRGERGLKVAACPAARLRPAGGAGAAPGEGSRCRLSPPR